jgi:PEP-CTERM motif
VNNTNLLHALLRCGGLIASLLLAPPLLAAQVQLTLTLSYFPASQEPPDPSFQDSVLTGTASFYEESSVEPCYLVALPGLGVGRTVSTSHIHDIHAGSESSFLFTFAGLAAGFPAFAFDTTDFPTLPPVDPDRIALGTYSGDAVSFEPVVFSGALVAYDAPVVVGTWEVTVSAVPEPESYALLLAGLGLLGFATRRGKQKAA